MTGVSKNGVGARPRIPAPLLFAIVLLHFLTPGPLHALEAGALPLRPGETWPLPRQRGLNEVEEVPSHTVACPACGYEVAVPEVDKLMRRPAAGEAPKWRMDAQSRDADLCPYPGDNKIPFQADIVICPSCGYAAAAGAFADPVSEEMAAWAKETLRPNLRAAQRALLGARGAEMAEKDVVDFFNQQSSIPDTIRTEHARICSLAGKTSKLAQAEATWLAAWANRREVAAPSGIAFLSRRAAEVATAMANAERTQVGLAGNVEAIRHLLGKNRAGRDRLPPAERLAARAMLAGLQLRLGFGQETEKELGGLYADYRERFQRPDQDPLWPATSSRASRGYRQTELETLRADAEREISVRLELVRSEQNRLKEATELIRAAILAGECDGKPEQALFYAYLVGEFLRRTNNLPLAAEWFKNVLILAPDKAPLRQAAEAQFAILREQAGNQVNLLSALGQDSELFEKLREICKK